MGAGRGGAGLQRVCPKGGLGPPPQPSHLRALPSGASGTALKLCRWKAGLTTLTFLFETAKLTMAEGMHCKERVGERPAGRSAGPEACPLCPVVSLKAGGVWVFKNNSSGNSFNCSDDGKAPEGEDCPSQTRLEQISFLSPETSAAC